MTAAPQQIEVGTGYEPRPLQLKLHRSLKRWNVLVLHRRFGKTVLAINEIIDRALQCPLPRPRYAYIAPLFVQAKSVAWDYLKAYTAGIPGMSAHESELRVMLPGDRRITLFGADNPDRLRGLYFDGVVFDEYANQPPSLFPKVIRPALADRQGWALFMGTPAGRNEFWRLYDQATRDPTWFAARIKASESGVLPAAELAAAARDMSPEEYEQEFECSFQAAILGAYYGRQIAAAEAEGRIGRVPYEPALQVETWWDLGMRDATAIWFVQRGRFDLRVIDFYQMTGEGLGHYAKVLRERPYVYSQHIAPHDIAVRELGTGKSRIELAAELGIHFTTAPQLGVDDGIETVRRTLPKCWFDAEKCAEGLEALRQYRKDFDERLKTFRASPRHDWASHPADAFRTGATASEPPDGWKKKLTYPTQGIV